MKIYIGSDHAGYELKEKLKVYLEELELGYEVIDKGAHQYNADDDYPDFSSAAAKAVAEDKNSFGIVIGASGQGEAMAANRIKGARAAVFYGQVTHEGIVDINGRTSADPFEIVLLARKHNNANILSLAARFLSEDEAKFAVELFLTTKFEEEEKRHIRRINKLG